MAIALVLSFQPSQLIILAEEVGIQLIGFSGDILSCCFLIT